MSSTKQASKAYLMCINQHFKLHEIYDNDQVLQAALAELIPGFEYPNHSHKTIGQIRTELKSKKGDK